MPRFDLDHDHDDFDEDIPFTDDPIHDDGMQFLATPPVSGKAITSLVCSVMFCIPMLPSVLGAIFGMLSLREINRGSRTGRGLGLSGLILGLLGVGAWLFVGAIGYLGYEIYSARTSLAREAATAFLQELSEGKVDKAMERTREGASKPPLMAASHAMKDWGRFKSLKKVQYRLLESKKPEFNFSLEGTAVFFKADRDVELRLLFDGSSYRVDQFKIGGKWAIGGGRWGE